MGDKPAHDPYLLYEHTAQHTASFADSECGLHKVFNTLAAAMMAGTCAYMLMTGKPYQAVAAGALAGIHATVARRNRRLMPDLEQREQTASLTIAACEMVPLFNPVPPPVNQLTETQYRTIGTMESDTLHSRSFSYGATGLTMAGISAAGMIANMPATTIIMAGLAIVTASRAFDRLKQARQDPVQLGKQTTDSFFRTYNASGLLVPRHPPDPKMVERLAHV